MHDLDDPYAYFAQLREVSPVHWVEGSTFYLVTTWDLISEVLARPEEFSSNLTATMVCHEDGTVSEFPIAELGSPLHVLATADDPLHREHRAMVMPSLVAKRVRDLAPFIDATFRQLWEQGLTSDGQIDWVQSIAQQLPMRVVAELLGLPSHDSDDLVRWAFASTMLLDGVVTDEQLADAAVAVGELSNYLIEAFDAVVDNPQADVMGELARAVAAGKCDRDTAIMMLIQMVAAGAESTISLLGTSVWLLAQHDDVVLRLRADRSHVPVFVEEALRLESPFRGHFRHVVDDTTLGDISLPAGSHLYLQWGAANRDPQQFEAPDANSLDHTERRSHMAFGKGIHMCVGAALARLETTIAIEALLDMTTDFTVETGNPQWSRSLMSRRLETLSMTATLA